MLLWKEGGLNGPFFAVNCRSVRIGSYKIVPVGRVLFSSEGIMLRAPVFYNQDKPSEKSAVFNVAIPAQQILKVHAHFSRILKVIFLNVGPSWCRQLSKKLGLSKSGPYWDSASEDENHKRLTLFPNDLDDAAKNAIKQVFVSQGVYHEIDHTEAYRLLIISSPPEIRDALKRLPTSTAVSAEASVSTTETQDVNGDGKEDSCKVEVSSSRYTPKLKFWSNM
jgi:sentrin-specific protease 7